MKIKFNMKEFCVDFAMLFGASAVASNGILPPETATTYAGLLGSTLKGISLERSEKAPIVLLADVINDSINKVMDKYELGLDQKLADILKEKIISLNTVTGSSTIAEKIPDDFIDYLKRYFAESDNYDQETFPFEAFTKELLFNIQTGVLANPSLMALVQTLHLFNNISNFEKSILNIRKVQYYTNPLHYLNQEIGFYGRDDEIEWLDKFKDSDGNFKFAVVQGVGGIGKSRLLNEYINRGHGDDNWYYCFLNDNVMQTIDSTDDFTCSKNVFGVIDYAERYTEIGKTLLKIAESKAVNSNIRLVLLMRNETDKLHSQSDILDHEKSLYSDSHQKRVLTEKKFGSYTMKELSDADYFRMIDDYTERVQKKGKLEENEKTAIVNGVKENRGFVATPLFVLLAADAYLTDSAMTKWNIVYVVESYVNKLLEFWKHTVCKDNEVLYKALLRLAAFSTGVGGVDCNAVLPAIIEESKKILLNNVEVLENSCGIQDQYFLPIQPDYIGEYIFLRFLQKELYFNRQIMEFAENVFYFSRTSFYFITRCIEDYGRTTEFGKLLESIVKQLKLREDYLLQYIIVLAEALLAHDQKEGLVYIQLVKSALDNNLFRKDIFFPIAMDLYHSCLTFLTSYTIVDDFGEKIDPNEAGWSREVAEYAFNELRKQFNSSVNDYPRLVKYYSVALANTSYSVSYEKAVNIKERLKTIYNRHKNAHPSVALQYAMAINNVISKIRESEIRDYSRQARKSLAELQTLYEENCHHEKLPSMEEPTVIVVVNAVKDPIARSQTSRALYDSLEEHNFPSEIMVEYAKALNNLVALYASKKQPQSRIYFKLLEQLSDESMNDKVRVEFAKSMVNMLLFARGKEADDMITSLKEMSSHSEEKKELHKIMATRYYRGCINRIGNAAQNNDSEIDVNSIWRDAADFYEKWGKESTVLTQFHAIVLYNAFAYAFAHNEELTCHELVDYLDKLMKETSPMLLPFFENCKNRIKHVSGGTI